MMFPFATPTPDDSRPGMDFNELLVTPGVIGFVVTALIAIAVILLLLDLNRRIRRVTYRAEAQQAIRDEIDQANAAEPAASTGATDNPEVTDPRD